MKIIKISQQIMVDMSQKRVPLTSYLQNMINKELNNMGSYFAQIPLDIIKNILKKYGIYLVQEDGTPWSGFLTGSKNCGEDGAEKQMARFDMIYIGKRKNEEEKTYLLNTWLHMTWCKMTSGKYEVVKFVN
jgi:hypothetical protein